LAKGKKEKAIDHKHHMKLQRDKELKRKRDGTLNSLQNMIKVRNSARE